MIIDTNALSAFVDGDEGIGSVLMLAQRVAIPVIVLGEFIYGIRQSRHRATYEHWLDANLRAFEILSITASTVRPYAGLRQELKKAGTPIPANDAWIAALALEHRLPVLSRDSHFDYVPALQRIAW